MINPTPIADKVPNGIEYFGSFKSPLMAIPAVNPVTAGKNIAKTTSILTDPCVDIKGIVSGANSEVPKKIETSEITIAPKIKN